MTALIEIVKQAAWLRRAKKAEQARRDAKHGTREWFAADERLRALLGAPSAADGRRALQTIMTGQQDTRYRQYGA
jgi:hypothetical protein